MDQNNSKNHWEQIYKTRPAWEVSWFQRDPLTSVQLIQSVSDSNASVIDIGAGASMLLDNLLKLGYSKLGMLDIAGAAIEVVKRRLGAQALRIEYYESDIRQFRPLHRYDIWHDRAVFHFLLEDHCKKLYVNALKHTLDLGGRAIIATFAQNGPKKCSGLDVAQYDNESIKSVLGDEFNLVTSVRETHRTPAGNEQHFIYFVFERG